MTALSTTLPCVQAKLKERAKQTKEMVIEQYKQEEMAAKEARQGPKELGDIDTDDEKDPEAEYESWRSRELRRIRCRLLTPGSP